MWNHVGTTIGYVGIMEKNMETTIAYWGYIENNGKEHSNYHRDLVLGSLPPGLLGFRGLGSRR